MLGEVKVLQGSERIRESFMWSPGVGVGRSEVGAAEGTTREGTAKRLKSVASVSVVLSTVAHSQLLTGCVSAYQLGHGTERWERRKARADWEPPVTFHLLTASSGRGGHSLTFTLEIRRGESSGEWEFPAKQVGKVQHHILYGWEEPHPKTIPENCSLSLLTH